MSRKQIIQIEITRESSWGSKLKIPWVTKTISDALIGERDVERIEVKEVKKR